MRDISLYLSTIPDYNQMLAGKNVLITTAARGIGKSIALLFARQGADVYFGGRNEEYVRTTEKELQSIRPGCRGYVVDLAKADQTEAFVDAAVKDSGGFDILVSTVGVNCHCPAAEYKDEDMFRLLETNYLSGVRCARKVIPTMQARGGGSIINISSIFSFPHFLLVQAFLLCTITSYLHLSLWQSPYRKSGISLSLLFGMGFL